MNLMTAKSRSSMPDAEWQARVDLAAAHRLAVMHDFHESIFNHLTAAVPGKTDRYYQIPFGLHWSEVTASCFLEVGWDGNVLVGEGEVERSAYCIHAPIHELNRNAVAVFHTHMPYASAVARLEDPRILPIGQTEIGFLDCMAYDEAYTGLAFDHAEGVRLAKMLGDKTVMMMVNHGVLVTGASIGEAYDRLYHLERACQVQLYAMWTNRPLRYVSDAVIERTRQQYRNSPDYANKSAEEHHFAALKRILDRREPDYRD
jgi:ribulose-5-phosphate 4-epimerase/fuculose-1-phosphate aldolase